MLSLSRLVRLQALFAALSLSYLLTSAVRQQITGEPLSAAAIGPSILMFLACPWRIGNSNRNRQLK